MGVDSADSVAINAQQRGLVPFPKGVSGNPSGKPKGIVSLRRRFREAFAEVPPDGAVSLADLVMEIARDWADPKQMEAIKFAAAYGFGPPPKKLDDESVLRLAEATVAQMIAQAKAARAEQAAEAAAKAPPP